MHLSYIVHFQGQSRHAVVQCSQGMIRSASRNVSRVQCSSVSHQGEACDYVTRITIRALSQYEHCYLNNACTCLQRIHRPAYNLKGLLRLQGGQNVAFPQEMLRILFWKEVCQQLEHLCACLLSLGTERVCQSHTQFCMYDRL